ncbi:MAG: PepSY domain-containing protein [Bacteroidota bacterium]
MGTLKSAKRWFWWHKWTSLVCTVFLLMLCLTGLPLIFHEEIEHWGEPEQEMLNEKAAKASLDVVMANGLKAYPKKVVRFLYWDEAKPKSVYLSLSDSVTAPPDNYKTLEMDVHTAAILEDHKADEGFMYIMLRLHVDMFAGIPGKLFLGLMGILFVIAIISGVVLYGPIMKKYDFGMIRGERSARLKWLDMHNLLGIVVLVWMSIVGITGVINTLSDVVLGLWQQGQLAEMTAPYKNQKPLKPGTLYSLEASTQTAMKAAPNMELALVAMPGTAFSSKHHYACFMRGTTPVTSRLVLPALIDAKNGKLTDLRAMPWYVNTLFLSEPLHFGDYGGLPLKIIWCILDIFTIVVLITGLYLWIARLKANKAQLARMGQKQFLTTEEEEGYAN